METLGKYGLLEKMGEGTLGTVYKAHDNVLHRFVALITLGADINWEPPRKERFHEEYRALLRLRHRNIAAVFDQGEDRKILYLVTELVPGTDIGKLIAEKCVMTLERKLGIMLQVTEGLGHAHAKGVLHRNLCPANIHLLHDGTVKITGFGFTSLRSSQSSLPRNQPAPNLYQSPEQLAGHDALAASDVFSLSLIFYEFLTGVHPFHDEDASKVLEDIQSRDHFATVEQFPDLPLNLWPILERCLAKNAEDRYPGIRDFGAACQSVLEELAEDSEWMRVELQTALPKLRKAARRPSAPLSLARLLCDAERALSRGEELDYQTLNRLVVTLAEHQPLMEGSADTPIPSSQAGEENQGTEAAEGETGMSAVEESASGASMLPAGPTDPPCSHPPATMAPPAMSKETEDSGAESSIAECPESPGEISGIQAGPGLPKSTQLPSSSPRVDSHFPDQLSRPSQADHKENLSELLRKIDQGQESTKRLVDSFLVGRQAGGAAKATEAAEGDRGKAGINDGKLNGAPPVSTPPRAMATTAVSADHLRQLVRQIRPAADHPSTAADLIDAVTDVSTALPKRERRRTALWICGSTLALVLAFAVPWVREQIGSVTGNRTAGSASGRAGGAQVDNPVAMALRNQLNSARRDILLEEAEVLRTIGRREESEVFLRRLLELYPGYAPARKELNRIRANAGTTAGPENPPAVAPRLPGNANPAAKSGNSQKSKTESNKAGHLAPGTAEPTGGRGIPETQHYAPAQSTAREVAAAQDLSRYAPLTVVPDVAGEIMRVVKDSAHPLETKSSARQQVYRFTVEHPHGVFRGNCKGNLMVDSNHVVYEPNSGPHGFSVPFKNLKIRVANKTVVLLFAADNSEFFFFRFLDAPAAQRLREVWDQLTALA